MLTCLFEQKARKLIFSREGDGRSNKNDRKHVVIFVESEKSLASG